MSPPTQKKSHLRWHTRSPNDTSQEHERVVKLQSIVVERLNQKALIPRNYPHHPINHLLIRFYINYPYLWDLENHKN